MHLKKLTVLLGSLAHLSHSTPTPSSPPSPPELASKEPLEERTTGVWLDLYHSGACTSGWEDQPKSGWVWKDQCKNFDSFTYGARLGKNDAGWPVCTLKFWENADCHGKATVHSTLENIEWTFYPLDGTYKAEYKCIAAANKDGGFYLNNGAASVSMTC